MPAVQDVKVWISVNGVALPEYKTEEVDACRKKCYIPSELGKKFLIHIQDRSPFLSQDVRTAANVICDGVPCTYVAFTSTDHPTQTIEGQHNGNAMRPFLFSLLKVTDHNVEGSDDSDLGCVRVRVKYIQCGAPYKRSRIRPRAALSDGPVSERAKKLTTHRVALGEPVFRTPSLRYKIVRHKTLPTYEFIFHYAPVDLLQAHDIIPTSRPPLPVVPPAPKPARQKRKALRDAEQPKSDMDFLSPNEAALYVELQEKIQRNKRVKVEEDVKAEERAINLGSSSRAITIDLTNDD